MSEINEQEIFAELEKDELNEELIKDNKYPFIFAGKKYRIVMPNQMNLVKAKRYKYQVFAQLVTEGVPVEKKWIKILKETQNVDIIEMNDKIRRIRNELNQIAISKAKTKDSEVKTRAKIDEKFKEIETQFLKLVYERNDYLSPTAEAQAKEEYYYYLTFLCTEFQVDEKEDKWEKVWKNFDVYQKEQSDLIYIAMGKLVDFISY